MVVIYYQTASGIQSVYLDKNNQDLVAQAVWIDLLDPNLEEEKIVETQLNLEIPTKKEIEEIEPSSRLYAANNALFMTATMVALSESPEVNTDVVSFILTEKTLITLRYSELNAFKLFSTKLLRSKAQEWTSLTTLTELLEASVDRIADILEKVSQKHDEISLRIFHKKTQSSKETNYTNVLQQIGVNGDLGAKASESLMTFVRLISYLEQTLEISASKEMLLPLNIIYKDVLALREPLSEA